MVLFDVQVRESVGSTNDELRAMAGMGARHGTVLRARQQTLGKGRQGRRWLSAPGNLYMSVLLDPARTLRHTAEIGFVAGVAVADAVHAMLPPQRSVQVKWPNDVLVGGAKISGILAELVPWDAGRFAVVVGIGLNVAHAPAGLPYPVTCLSRECIGDPDRATLDVASTAQRVLASLDERWTEWVDKGFGPIRDRWLRRGPAHGAILSISLPDGTVVGSFEDLDMDGALMLRASGGTHRFLSGDVAY